MLDNLVGLSSLCVSVIYVIIGILIVPNLRFPLWATLMAAAFFVGCALTHAHIASEAFASDVTPPLHAYTMVALHAAQGVGGTGFIAAVARRRLVVRLEE